MSRAVPWPLHRLASRGVLAAACPQLAKSNAASPAHPLVNLQTVSATAPLRTERRTR